MRLINYSLLSIPLAALVPVMYFYLPQYFALEFGVSLTLAGLFIIVPRIIDALQDPFLGYLSDRYDRGSRYRTALILVFSCVLAISFLLLINPQIIGSKNLDYAAWLGVFSALVYSFYSFVMINYQALLAQNKGLKYKQQNNFVFAREAGFLAGMAVLGVLVMILAEKSALYISIIISLSLLAAAFLLYKTTQIPKPKALIKPGLKQALKNIIKNRKFLKLAQIYFLNIFANIMFLGAYIIYASFVLKLQYSQIAFIGVYILSALAFLPLWHKMVNIVGRKNCWIYAICTSAIAYFITIFNLGTNPAIYFLIFFIAGSGLGASIAIAPAILTQNMHDKNLAGTYFGMWNMTSKLAYLFAAFTSFMILSEVLGLKNIYNIADMDLSLLYGIIPFTVQIVAAYMLYESDLDIKN